MCAAPGSKTSQLIEYLHTGCGDKVPGKCFFYLTTFFLLLFIQLPFSLAEGIVIANDDSHDRCYTLIHQTKRLRSPSTLIVNHDASLFPTILLEKEGVSVPMQFDRILADVPCSGDGTMRKNPGVWQRWSTLQGGTLHSYDSIFFVVVSLFVGVLEMTLRLFQPSNQNLEAGLPTFESGRMFGVLDLFSESS